MSQKFGEHNNKVYRLVLTGGPCGGKTTGQARLCTFFENLGWKVYRVPECATVLMGGGVKWNDLSAEQSYRFQENLLKTMLEIENTFFDLAAYGTQDTLVICDRGAMDASAYLPPDDWARMCKGNNWNEVELRDNRYNQVIHMVSAAKGAEAFYQTEHVTRHENVDLARRLDDITAQAWVGHPYYDVIDNSTDFERKLVRMIAAVCNWLGVDAGDRLSLDSRKHKYLVKALPSDESIFPKFQDFMVAHDYLATPNSKMQARIRRRGQNVTLNAETRRWDMETGNWTYTHTIRRPAVQGESPELKMQITLREYELLLAQKDLTHYSLFKRRRCFLWNNQYFQMDIYQEPCPPSCRGLVILETYTAQVNDLTLPDFLEIERDITNESVFSMYTLSRKPASAMHSRFRSSSEGEDTVAKATHHHVTGNGNHRDIGNATHTVNSAAGKVPNTGNLAAGKGVVCSDATNGQPHPSRIDTARTNGHLSASPRIPRRANSVADTSDR